jgi:hypothetical protein
MGLKPECRTCRFWFHDTHDEKGWGDCRRRAPTSLSARNEALEALIGTAVKLMTRQMKLDDCATADAFSDGAQYAQNMIEGPRFADWPQTMEDDWCGEWDQQ